MSESKPQPKRSLVKAKAVLEAQWPEVLQYLGDRSAFGSSSHPDLSVAQPALNLAIEQVTTRKALAASNTDSSK